MITLLSSMAQEESRSISDNVKWGYRKRMADGKYHVAYSRFLGYTKGNTTLEIDEKEAEIARYIYYLFFAGKSDNYIAEKLNSQKIASPGSGKKWAPSTIRSILTNEKYCGNALLHRRTLIWIQLGSFFFAPLPCEKVLILWAFSSSRTRIPARAVSSFMLIQSIFDHLQLNTHLDRL